MRRAVRASIILAILAACVSACGGSSSTAASHAGQNDSDVALVRGDSNAQSRQSSHTSARAKAASPAHDPVTYSRRPARARKLANAPNDEINSTGAKAVNPCTLVTRSEARAIVGRPIVKTWQAPQGPTCIYHVRGAKRYITLALQRTKVSTLRKHARTISHRTIRGHNAYCLKLGTTLTLVQLASTRVLQVTAPCPIGARFASKALTRL